MLWPGVFSQFGARRRTLRYVEHLELRKRAWGQCIVGRSRTAGEKYGLGVRSPVPLRGRRIGGDSRIADENCELRRTPGREIDPGVVVLQNRVIGHPRPRQTEGSVLTQTDPVPPSATDEVNHPIAVGESSLVHLE